MMIEMMISSSYADVLTDIYRSTQDVKSASSSAILIRVNCPLCRFNPRRRRTGLLNFTRRTNDNLLNTPRYTVGDGEIETISIIG